ncbi:hypothetical protein [Streptomyces sp. NBC_00078]|uniref:hypothetical protein n=1 Tax=unclassified Streptomyces TaxID=2593676 RepID=UPI0022577A8D|nr:hypothetical protein [Streptomyces sp. NBC_00078]MCX5425341.1 hypothetical protein [Streptomyces sp. NBC_00078]
MPARTASQDGLGEADADERLGVRDAGGQPGRSGAESGAPAPAVAPCFRQPPFSAGARPLWGGDAPVFTPYGTHFTQTFHGCCPDRSTPRRTEADNRMAVLAEPGEEAVFRGR